MKSNRMRYLAEYTANTYPMRACVCVRVLFCLWVKINLCGFLPHNMCVVRIYSIFSKSNFSSVSCKLVCVSQFERDSIPRLYSTKFYSSNRDLARKVNKTVYVEFTDFGKFLAIQKAIFFIHRVTHTIFILIKREAKTSPPMYCGLWWKPFFSRSGRSKYYKFHLVCGSSVNYNSTLVLLYPWW